MSEYSGGELPFAVGQINGLRAFDVDTNGDLVGPVYPAPWSEGENVAVCRTHTSFFLNSGQRRRPAGGDDHCGFAKFLGFTGPKVRIPSRDHTCGFYAYYDGSNRHGNTFNVTGIIQGYGKVVYGSAGFRAEKARIVALVNPNLLSVDATKRDFKRRLAEIDSKTWMLFYVLVTAVVLVVTAGHALSEIPYSDYLFWGLHAVLWSVVLPLDFVRSRARTKFAKARGENAMEEMIFLRQFDPSNPQHVDRLRRSSLPSGSSIDPALWRKVTKKYPNIPQFATLEEALEQYPLENYYRQGQA